MHRRIKGGQNYYQGLK
uniref:Uncharacterized protein n=1 Tax=Vitis vinifera TaxID=29760 RepID=F6HFR5_VITVI